MCVTQELNLPTQALEYFQVGHCTPQHTHAMSKRLPGWWFWRKKCLNRHARLQGEVAVGLVQQVHDTQSFSELVRHMCVCIYLFLCPYWSLLSLCPSAEQCSAELRAVQETLASSSTLLMSAEEVLAKVPLRNYVVLGAVMFWQFSHFQLKDSR